MLQRRGIMAGAGAFAMAAMTRRPAGATPAPILISQPSFLNGIAPNLGVNGVIPAYNPVGSFYMRANQANPFSPEGYFPMPWDAGAFTGLHVPTPASFWQRGIWSPMSHSGIGHTVAQVYGPVVAAYLNSNDLIDDSPGHRMMIAPDYVFAGTVVPFSAPSSLLGVSFQLQVPAATTTGSTSLSNAYIKLDFLLYDTTNNTGAGRMSLSCGVFALGTTPKGDGGGFDPITFTAIASAVVSPIGRLVTLNPGSAVYSSKTWLGWRTFSFTISYAQFAQATAYANAQAILNGYTLSPHPEDYVLSSAHLNAEMHYTLTQQSTLGWSMSGLTVTQLA